jgi:hypothetical protein
MNSKINTISKYAGLLSTALSLAFASTGCVTKSEADARARIAFLEGQNQALMRMQGAGPQGQPAQMTGPGVTFVGPVQNLNVPWRTGLTLTQAIVSAQYTGPGDPAAIVIRRNGQDIPINPKGLLNGEDFVLQIGDVIEIRQ